MIYRKLVWFPLFLLAVSTFSTPFTADEVFVYAEISRGFRSNPSDIWRVAWSAYESGRVQGRLVSPIFHFLSNLGVAATEYFSEVFSTDLYVANGVARVVLLWLSCLLFASIISGFGNANSKATLFRLAVVLFPGLLVLNRRYAAGRISIWSYLLALVVVLILIRCVQLLFMWAVNQRVMGKWATSSLLISVVALGFLFGTTYEATRIVIPTALFIAVHSVFSGLKDESWRIRKHTVAALLVFGSTSVGSAIYVQLANFSGCSAGCYQAAQVRPEYFRFSSLAARVLGQFPAFSIPEGLISSVPLRSATWAVGLTVLTALICLFLFRGIAIESRLGSNVDRGRGGKKLSLDAPLNASLGVQGRLRRLAFVLLRNPASSLCVSGILWCTSIGIGMAASRTVSDLSNPWDRLGVGSRDALLMHTGWAFIYVGFLYWVLSSERKSLIRRGIVATILMIFSLTISFSQISNISTTKRELSSPEVEFQKVLFSVGLHSFGEEGNSLRCSIFQSKVSDYKEWLGHDQMIYYGFNNRYKAKYGYPFCSITPDQMFLNYDE